MRIEAFVIHLARAHQRRPQVEQLCAALPMPAHIVDAVDGRTLDDAAVAAVYERDLHRPRYPFALGKGEIGCFLSHRKAWQEIVERDLDAGLIVEDDVEVGPDFPDVLKVATEVSSLADYVRFPRRTRGERTREALATSGDVAVMRTRLPGLGTQAQLVGRDAARMLLDFTRVFDRPVDTTLQMQWLHRVRMLTARPVTLREIHSAVGGSVVQAKGRPISHVLGREVRRSAYRLSLWLLALRLP